MYVCCGGPSLCPAFVGSKKNPKTFSPFLFLSFANTVLVFTFLAPFFWNSQKCPISQNIWCLIKTQLKKTASKQFFKGVVHEQPWSSIVCLLWWSSIVSSVFFGSKHFPKSLSPFLFLSFAIALVSYLVQFSWHPLLGFYGVSMGFWQNFYGNSMYIISLVFLWYSMVFLKVCLW